MIFLLVVDLIIVLNFGINVLSVFLVYSFIHILADHAAVMTISTPHPVYCLFQLSQSILLAGCDKDIIVYDLLSDGKLIILMISNQ